MPPKSKVAQSIHYNEIMDKIREGKSSREISRWLKKEYNEDIGHGAISRYKKDNLEAEALDIADVNLKKKHENPLDNEKKSIEKKHVTDRAAAIQEGTVIGRGIAEATAEQIQGLLDVSRDYPDAVRKMESEADDPDSNTSWKDVANEKRNAQKLYLDFIKSQENNVEVNVENNMNDLSQLFDTNKIRERLNAKRKLRKSKSKSKSDGG